MKGREKQIIFYKENLFTPTDEFFYKSGSTDGMFSSIYKCSASTSWVSRILESLHEYMRNHSYKSITKRRIWQDRYWWLTLYKKRLGGVKLVENFDKMCSAPTSEV